MEEQNLQDTSGNRGACGGFLVVRTMSMYLHSAIKYSYNKLLTRKTRCCTVFCTGNSTQ